MKETIRIYARLKPLNGKKTSCQYDVSQDQTISTDCLQNQVLQLSIPKQLADGFVNNTRELFRFQFDGILESAISQADVFETVARPIVDRALDGYNGTLFAYGQTGSGKTFTVTGTSLFSHDSKVDSSFLKGIIPRALTYIFDQMKRKKVDQASEGPNSDSVCISYFEIYNEAGYDLLQTRETLTELEDLPKIQLLEDAEQNVHLRNLSVHRADSEKDAMNLLAAGEVNRVMAETPMNQTSTRSHCIFTIIISRRNAGSAVLRTSKLHIVDLAGSERVYKNGIVGRSLMEAKCINLALHHLEQVIIALAETNRSHVPYRNSLMTSILKDSLGGNSLTSMIATCSLEEANIGETISTCRFAQRVALVRNNAARNETFDPFLEIELLKRQIEQLKNTCFLLHGGIELTADALTEEEMTKCQEHLNDFLTAGDGQAELVVDLDWRKLQYCFRMLKRGEFQKSRPEADEDMIVSGEQDKLDKMQITLQQRDREMAILCRLLRQEKKRSDELLSSPVSPVYSNDSNAVQCTTTPLQSGPAPVVQLPAPSHLTAFNPPPEYLSWLNRLSQLTEPQVSDLKRALLTKFVDGHSERSRVEDLKRNLTERINQARLLGTNIRRAQADVQNGTHQLLHLQSAGNTGTGRQKEENLRHEVESAQMRQHNMLEQLRSLKEQVQYFEKLTREVTNVMQAQFDQWWTHVSYR